MHADTPLEVLVVEDEPLVRIVAADAIVDSGIMAWEAADAAEALHVLGEHPRIGLIVTDVNMPGEMDGLALAERVAEGRPDLSVIVTSAKADLSADDIPGGGELLRKPYRTERLVQAIHRALERLHKRKNPVRT